MNFVLDIVNFIFQVQPAKYHGESTSTASKLSHKTNKVPLLLQNFDLTESKSKVLLEPF